MNENATLKGKKREVPDDRVCVLHTADGKRLVLRGSECPDDPLIFAQVLQERRKKRATTSRTDNLARKVRMAREHS